MDGISRTDTVCPKLLKANNDMIVAGLATVIGREEMARKVIGSILPQVDVLHVCFSGYLDIPDWAKGNDKLKAETDSMNVLHDCAKFKWVPEYKDAYYFSIDDDLNYPSNYVEYMLGYIKQFDNEVVISFHGRTCDYTERNNYCWELDKLTWFPVLGTGACAFHTSYITFEVDDFLESMANSDYMMAVKVASQNKVSFVIPKKANFVTELESVKRQRNGPTCGSYRKRNIYVKRKRELTDIRLLELCRKNGRNDVK